MQSTDRVTTRAPKRGATSATVTFLATDIEGSTRLWQNSSGQMQAAVARHEAILRDAIDSRNGHIFLCSGDGLYAAFATVGPAAAAAIEAQTALQSEAWPDEAHLRVRMAIHSGEVNYSGAEYTGATLNTVSRILDVGHGSQILLSGAARELILDQLPKAASLRDLGVVRLRDIARPERLFQLNAPDIESRFPSLKSLDECPNNLPLQTTSFVGRETELASINELVSTTRLLTLVGPGGAGKTRLSLKAGAGLMAGFPDGVWFVELAALADSSLLPRAVADALGGRGETVQDAQKWLLQFLQPKKCLLVLDNCEHLVLACATLAEALLQSCPAMSIVATSREPLGVIGEQTFFVPSLRLPDTQSLPPLDVLKQFEAVELFIDRATTADPSFHVDVDDVHALATVCHRLDGIPLAIELAAARVRVLPLRQITDKLDNRFRLLTGGSRTALPRQQTLRGAIDWSYDLLSEPERLLLARLSVFSGGWTLDAAEAVCSDEKQDFDLGSLACAVAKTDILERVASLAAKSLVHVDEVRGHARYRLLESLREYALERLEQRGELVTLRDRHFDWILQAASECASKLDGPDQAQAMTVLDDELGNIRSALNWIIGNQTRHAPTSGMQLSRAMRTYWAIRGHFTEARALIIALIDKDTSCEQTIDRANAIFCAGDFALELGDHASGLPAVHESLEIYRKLGDSLRSADALNILAIHAQDVGKMALAQQYYSESLALDRACGNLSGEATVLYNMASVLGAQGDMPGAQSLLNESLLIYRRLGNKRFEAAALGALADTHLRLEQYDSARTLYEQALEKSADMADRTTSSVMQYNYATLLQAQGNFSGARLRFERVSNECREVGEKHLYGCVLCSLGDLCRNTGDLGDAVKFLHEGISVLHGVSNVNLLSIGFDQTGNLAFALGECHRAALFHGAAEVARERIGTVLAPVERSAVLADVAAIQRALGEAAFEAAWNDGRELSVDDAVRSMLSFLAEAKDSN